MSAITNNEQTPYLNTGLKVLILGNIFFKYLFWDFFYIILLSYFKFSQFWTNDDAYSGTIQGPYSLFVCKFKMIKTNYQ